MTRRRDRQEQEEDRVEVPVAYLDAIDRLVSSLQETNRGILVRGARAVDITESDRPLAGKGRLYGLALRETAGAVAEVTIRGGRDATGTPLLPITLGADQSTSEWFGPGGIDIGDEGLFVDLISGAVEGCLYIALKA